MSYEHEVSGDLNNEVQDDSLIQTPESGPIQPIHQRPLPNAQWKSASRTVEENLAKGLSNEDLWMLIRRFDKQIYHVRAVQDAKAQPLDLNRVDSERFPPEKLRITLERFYTSVVVGVIEFFRHITRLRSWKESGRTTVFCIVYFTCWAFDILVPTICGVMVSMIMIPQVRAWIFPATTATLNSEIPSARNSETGQPESLDSLTGAPEAHKGEAAEQEARNLIDSLATVAIESAATKYGQAVAEDAPDQPLLGDGSEVVDPMETPIVDSTEDKTKKPMKKKVSHATNQLMRGLSDVTDIYEKFANYWIVKIIGFTIGFGFFGDPVFTYTLDTLNQKIPNWRDNMDLQKTLLAGVPTNAQLTLTLLRIGEINSEPLPPPPAIGNNDRAWPISRKKSQAGSSSLDLTKQDSSPELQKTNSNISLPEAKPKRRTMFKFFKFLRRTIATAIQGHIAFDRAMAIAGSAHTKNLLGMLQNRHFSATPFGPLKFDAKYERKRGAAVIDNSKEPPILYFTTYQSAGLDDLRIESRKKGSVLFQIPVTDIKELKKTEGLGWKRKLIVELTAGSKEAADGLVVSGDDMEQSYHLTGMRSRNQLFNRLVAMDAQFWESR
ncbi:hypothetical protein N7466_010348 [Penicillium verhagenii]|uniref:uncharacterized protein n=1 Tax=Penicillium verhagenii TaxID=1562060 RepID=UPI0025452637|nr:uncharacterized protein N7466_010348 [Penicillium verhagenii]KAJ5919405.1 hypothetical protein N7466_010348 [Penicillium verhagenii]